MTEFKTDQMSKKLTKVAGHGVTMTFADGEEVRTVVHNLFHRLISDGNEVGYVNRLLETLVDDSVLNLFPVREGYFKKYEMD